MTGAKSFQTSLCKQIDSFSTLNKPDGLLSQQLEHPIAEEAQTYKKVRVYNKEHTHNQTDHYGSSAES